MAGKLICVGMIAGVHGVKGMVKLQSFTEPREALRLYPLLDEVGNALAMHIIAQPNGQILARIEGLDDRTQAEGLKGKRLYVKRAALPAPAAGEFYHSDLIGMAVRATDGASLGEIVAVHNFGASDIVEIGGARAKTIMLPFTDAFVPHVDIEARTVTIAAYEETQ